MILTSLKSIAAVGLVLLAIRTSPQATHSLPEAVSGPWECVDSNGVHGIFFEGTPEDPAIFVYERRTEGTQYGGYFSTDPRYFEGRTRVELVDNRLSIHFEKSISNRPAFDLQLSYDAAVKHWSGSWSDCNAGRVAILTRPGSLTSSSQNSLIGDWQEETEGAIRRPDSQPAAPVMRASGGILRIRQSVDGQLMVWLTNFEGRVRRLPLQLRGDTVTLNPIIAAGRQSHYVGQVSSGGATIIGRWIFEGLGSTQTVYRRQ